MRIFNKTGKTEAEITALPLVGIIRTNWRQRTVSLYKDPQDEAMLYMHGVTFDQSTTVISHEQIGMNEHIAMDYWDNGQKVLTRD